MMRLRGIAMWLPLVLQAQVNPQPARLEAIRINTADRAVQMRFWTELLPCRVERNSAQCNGARIDFTDKAPTGPSNGSVINHIGFFVPSFEDYIPKLSDAGYKYTRITTGNQIMIEGPDGVRVELTSNSDATTSISFHHIHFSSPDPKAMQAWYARILGAIPGKRAQWDAADLPGANLTFAQANGPVEGTRGRAIDGIGLAVSDLDRILGLLRSTGLKPGVWNFVSGPNHFEGAEVADPWGAYMTMTHSSN